MKQVLPNLGRLVQTLKRLDSKQQQSLLLAFLVLFSGIYPLLTAGPVQAAVTKVYYRPDRMAANTAANGSVSGSVCITTSTVGTESSMTIIFPSGWTLDTTLANWTLDTSATNIPVGTTQWASTATGNATAVNNSTKAVTFTVGDVTASTETCLHLTAAGSTTTSVSGNDQTGSIATNIDSATAYATAQTSGASSDQIGVTASVPATFSFALGANTAALGTLSTSSVTSATGVTATISTNARSGWEAWVKNTTNGLYSTTASAAIPAPGAFGSTFDLSTTTGYGLDVNAGSGTPTIDTAYDGTGDVNNVGVLQSNFKPIATKTTPGSADTITLRLRAKVSATQQAATDYSDTLTVVAAGKF